jgi:hypothetical protein
MTKKVARPEQQGAAPEPVAWISPRSLARVCLSHETQVWLYAAPDEVYSVPLYAAPIEGATEPPIPLSDYEEAKRQERLWQQAKTRPWAEPPTSEATRERPSPQTAGQDSEGLGRAISASPPETPVPQTRSEKMRQAGFTRRPSPPGKMAGGLWREDGETPRAEHEANIERLRTALAASPPETPVPQSEPLTKAGLQIRPFVVSEHLRSAEDVREFLLACLAEPFGLAEDREPFLANAIKHAINGLVAQTPAPQSEPVADMLRPALEGLYDMGFNDGGNPADGPVTNDQRGAVAVNLTLASINAILAASPSSEGREPKEQT